MRASIGGTWLLGLMLTFILLFVSFIILTLNYSKTIRIKNDMVSVMEKYEGLNENSIQLMNNFLLSNAYRATGVCTKENKAGVYGGLSLSSNQVEEARPGVRYYYCIQKYKGASLTNYYQISVFYRFNLPVIGDAAGFVVRGTTSNFYENYDSDYDAVIGG